MTSLAVGYNQIPANKLYINVVNVVSTIVDSNNNPVPWAVVPAVAYALSTPGAAVFRDMGRDLFRPNPNVPTAVGSQSSILRKVQLVTNGSSTTSNGVGGSGLVGGYNGTGNNGSCVAGSATDFYTGYIRLGGQTYAGGTGLPTGVARLN
jgi:hypothetical protein